MEVNNKMTIHYRGNQPENEIKDKNLFSDYTEEKIPKQLLGKLRLQDVEQKEIPPLLGRNVFAIDRTHPTSSPSEALQMLQIFYEKLIN